MIKRFIFLIFLLLAGIIVLVYFLTGKELEVTLTEADLREKIEEAFPIEENYLMVVRLRLSDPEVRLREDSDRILYRMKATVFIPGKEIRGEARVSGKIRYDAGLREFYLEDSHLEDLDIEGIPSEYRKPLTNVANVATRELFERYPIYDLDEEILGKLKGTVAIRNVKIVDGKVRISFGLDDRLWKKYLPF